MKNKIILKTATGLLVITFALLGLSTLPTKVLASTSLSLSGTARVEDTNGSIYFDQYTADISLNPSTGVFTGYAWSDDLGWVNFDNNDEGNSVIVNTTTGVVTGQAHIVETGVKIDFTNHNSNVVIDITNGTFSGYAWSEDIGWIDFTEVSLSDDTYPFDLTDPNIRITDIGLINNVSDLSEMTYYFTSTTPKIKGQTEKYSTVCFKLDGETFNTTTDSKGLFSIEFDIENGANDITYYSVDRGENKSETRSLTLIVGEENLPNWVIDILYPKDHTDQEKVNNDQEDGVGIPDEETQEEIERNKILVVDENGNILKNTKITIDGIDYLTDENGHIVSEKLAREAIEGVYNYKPTQEDDFGGSLEDEVVIEEQNYFWLWILLVLFVSGSTYYYVKNRRAE